MPHHEHLRPPDPRIGDPRLGDPRLSGPRADGPRVPRPPLPRMRLPPLAEIGFIGLRVVLAVTVAMAAYATLHGMRA
jgi:hypothetical protein